MSILDPLIALQTLDGNIRDCKQIIADIPKRTASQSQRLESQNTDVEQAQDRFTRAQAKVAESELEIGARREKIEKLRQQQLQLKTNREFKAMETEISILEKEIDRFETEQIEAMVALEPLRKDLAEAEQGLVGGKAEVARDIEDLEQRLRLAEARCAELVTQRTGLADGVEPRLLLHYERMLHGKWPPLVPMENDACGGCHMAQPPAIRHAACRRNDIVTCQYCGRMLY